MNVLLPLSGREKTIQILFGVRNVLNLAIIAYYVYAIYFWQGYWEGIYTEEEAIAMENYEWMWIITYLILTIAIVVFYCIWKYRAFQNLYRAQLPGIEHTAGWSVGWYFIPVASLWKPFQAMRELARGSAVINGTASPQNWKFQPFASLFGWWWAIYIFSGVVDNVASRWSAEDFSIIYALMFSYAVDIVSVFLAMAVIRKVTRMQSEPSMAFMEGLAVATPGRGYEDVISRPAGIPVSDGTMPATPPVKPDLPPPPPTPSYRNIIPGVGLGDLKFGMDREQVQMMMGPPTDMEDVTYSESPDDARQSWHYESLELTLAFDASDGWCLTSLTLESRVPRYRGASLMGLNRSELFAKMEEVGILGLEIDREVGGDGYLIKSEALNMDFWMTTGRVAEIQWRPFLDANGNVRWPR